jgi:predicted Zn finger-like uncharacterized protein
MSLLTQCPACQTYYRVVPDQLRISDGWVKCGQCGDIFDASMQLLEIDTDAGSSEPASQPDSPPDNRFEGVPETPVMPNQDPVAPGLKIPADLSPIHLDRSIEPDPVQGEFPEGVSGDQIEAATGSVEPTWATQETDVDTSNEVLPQLVFPEDEPIVADDALPEPEHVRWDDNLQASAGIDPAPVSSIEAPAKKAPTEDSVTFLGDEQGHSVWHKPMVRRGLISLMGVLLVTLVGQWIYRERDQLSAMHPALKPTLQAACMWLGCAIQPIRQIDALTIESAAFNKLDNNTYRLSFLVKNASEFSLAYPAVELVLTDAQDQAAYRRVLSSSELGTRAAELAAGTEWPVTVALRLDALGGTQRVFGYRLLVFYP